MTIAACKDHRIQIETTGLGLDISKARRIDIALGRPIRLLRRSRTRKHQDQNRYEKECPRPSVTNFALAYSRLIPCALFDM